MGGSSVRMGPDLPAVEVPPFELQLGGRLTLTVKAGGKPTNKGLVLKRGKEATFKVKPEGSILTRTSVTLNGQTSEGIVRVRDDPGLEGVLPSVR